MAIHIDQTINDLFGKNLFDVVSDFLTGIDLNDVLSIGKFVNGFDVGGLLDDLTGSLGTFFDDFNLLKLFDDVDNLLGGVKLIDVDFDDLLKNFLGDLSLNKVLDDLGGLLGGDSLENLFGKDDLNGFAGQVRNIVGDIFDDFSSGIDDIFGGTLKGNSLKGNLFNNILDGKDGNDSLLGLGGDDLLLGGKGNDYLNAGKGDDVLFGGSGNETLTGSLGRDIFAIAEGVGRALITDFVDGRDALSILGSVAFSDLTIKQKGLNTLIRHGDDILAVLKGVGSAMIDVADFVQTL